MNRLLTKAALRCIAVTSLVFGLLALPQPAFAQTDSTTSDALSVSPPLTEIDGAPGQVITRKVTIDNVSDKARAIRVSAENFHASGEEGQAELEEGVDAPNTVKTWTKVSPTTATIPPKGSQAFEVKIEVPKNPSPGGHFVALVFEPGVDNSNPEANVKVVSRVTSLMLLRLPGDVQEKATIASFTTSTSDAKPAADGQIPPTSFFQKGPVDFHVRVKNEGNVQVKPEITVEVRNIFGSKIATLQPEARNVLPDSIRRFDVKWNHKHLFGLYKATAIVKYGEAQETIETNTSFYGAPLATVGFGGGGLIGLFLLLWLPRKRIRKALKALASSD